MEPLVIDIETDDRSLSMTFDQSTVRGSVVLPGLVYQGLIVRKGGDVLSDVLRFVIDGSIALEINLLSNWLYDKVKARPRPTQIRIRRKIVEKVTPEGIERVIREEIEGPINRD
jgi:hypothetical protein